MDNNVNTNKYQNLIWIMLLVHIIFILMLLVVGMSSYKVGNTLPTDSDVFIVGTSSSNNEDEIQKWETKTKVDIFKTSYVDGENNMFVVSSTDEKVFAPGTTTNYKFTMLNQSDTAIIYDTSINFVLKINNEVTSLDNLPFMVRLSCDNGEYIIGDENKLENICIVKGVKHPGILGSNSFSNYNLEISWPYEGNNDLIDTWLGDKSNENGVTLTLEINANAEESDISSLVGGTKLEVDDNNSKQDSSWIILLIINIIILIFFYIIWLSNHKRKFEI